MGRKKTKTHKYLAVTYLEVKKITKSISTYALAEEKLRDLPALMKNETNTKVVHLKLVLLRN